MKIYIIMKVIPYEGSMIEEVYTDRSEAKKHIEAYNFSRRLGDNEYLIYYVRDLKDKYEV